jgi:hypothetical protein
MQVFRSRFDELAGGMTSFDLIIDLRDAKPPGAEVGEWLGTCSGAAALVTLDRAI